ncbi:MAG: hypothetical protein ACOCTN_07635 [Candidatus Natronoplasma sp.]
MSILESGYQLKADKSGGFRYNLFCEESQEYGKLEVRWGNTVEY